MSATLSILIILIASIALVKGVGLFTDSVSQLAQKFKISTYTVSFFLVAIGTSLPETVVAVTSAIEQNPILAFGNAMGSNIALITIVIAIPTILTSGLATRPILNSRDIYYTALFTILPLTFVIDGTLSRIDGILLLIGYAIYARAVLRRARGIESLLDNIEDVQIIKQAGIFLLSLLMLLGSSELIVRSAINLSVELGIGLGFIGLTVTALGTSLPEIAFSMSAIKNNEKDEILGDIVGSVVANSTLVLGLASTIKPINVAQSKIGVPTIFLMVFILLVFLRFARTKEKFDTVEGLSLLTLYILFIAVEYYVSSMNGF